MTNITVGCLPMKPEISTGQQPGYCRHGL